MMLISLHFSFSVFDEYMVGGAVKYFIMNTNKTNTNTHTGNHLTHIMNGFFLYFKWTSQLKLFILTDFESSVSG